MFVVLITDKKLGGTTPYGPYRTRERALAIKDLSVSSWSADFFDPEKYDVVIAKLRKFGES